MTTYASIKNLPKLPRYFQWWGKVDSTGRPPIRIRVPVPPELRSTVGKTELVRGLDTRCVREAERRERGNDIIKTFQRRIDAAWAEVGKPKPEFGMTITPPRTADALALAMVSARLMAGDTHYPVLHISSEAAKAVETLPPITYEAGLAEWVTSHGSEPPADTTQEIYRSHLARLFGWLAHDEMGRVSEQNIIDYPQVLLTGADGGRRLANKAVNNNMGSIRAVFRVCKDKRKTTRDPTVGTIKKLPVPKKSRKSFTRADHAKIIAAARKSDDPAIKWLWLIGCLMGARIGELADATVDAVQEIAGIWVLNINEDHRRIWHGKPIPLKTDESTRIVPLHSAIINAGFLGYVADIRREHAEGDRAPLFPNFSANRHGRFSGQASRRCMTWLRDVIGIDDPKLVNHSLRHTLKTLLRGRVTDEVSNAITGHKSNGVGAQYGETEIIVMADAIELIRVQPQEGAARGSRRVAA